MRIKCNVPCESKLNYIRNTPFIHRVLYALTVTLSVRYRIQVFDKLPDDDDASVQAKVEYEKLKTTFREASEKEKVLTAKCAALSDECRAQAAKMALALNLSQEDQSTIDALKVELERAWTMVDASNESELESKRVIAELKNDIERLTNGEDDEDDDDFEGDEVWKSNSVLSGDLMLRASARKASTREIESLLSTKEALTAERDELLEQTIKLREDIVKLNERTRQAESTKLDLDVKLQNLRDAAHADAAEAERQNRAKECLERELREVKERSDAREEEIKNYRIKIAKTDEIIGKLENDTKFQQRRTEAAQKELNVLASKSDKLHRELDEARRVNKCAEDANEAKVHEIKALKLDIQTTEREREKQAKLSAELTIKLRAAEQSKLNTEEAKNALKREVQLLEQQLDQQKRDLDNETRRKDDLMRERDVLLKTTTQAQNATSRQQDLLRIHEAQRQTLENEIKSYKMEQSKQEIKMKHLDQERAALVSETMECARKQEKLEEDVREREATIVDLQHQLRDAEAQIKHAEHAYDVVRTERNFQSKSLIEAQTQIADIKRDFKAASVALEAYREEIRSKEAVIAGERFEHRKLDKEHDSLRRQHDKLSSTLRETQDALKISNEESKTMRAAVATIDENRENQRKEIDVIKRDRDVLSGQLVRRNQECALLYEKIKIQQKILNQGQAEYRDRVKEVKTLKLKLAAHARELTNLRDAAASIDKLKTEVQNIGRDLLYERTKVKALSEELENPMNVHRWRQLKGSDPTMYELIQKVQVLQRRLIAKTEEVTEKEMLVDEKTKVLEDLRVVLARQPGPRAFEELRDTHVAIREKSRQIKGLQSELKMFIAHRDAYTHELSMLHEELANLRRRRVIA